MPMCILSTTVAEWAQQPSTAIYEARNGVSVPGC